MFGAYALVTGLLTLLGWSFNLRRLTAWDNRISQMPNAAIAVAAAGAGLIFWSLSKRRPSIALGAAATLIAVATIFQHLTGVNLGIDTLILHREWGQMGTVSPGRMGVPASVSLAIIGMSLILTNARQTKPLVALGGLISMSIAMLSLIGYLFGANPLYAIPRLTTIAIQTSTMVFALGAGLLATVAEARPPALLRGDSGSALLVRLAVPVVFFLPLLLGWLSLRGQKAGLFDTAFGTGALVFVLIGLLIALLWGAASAVAVHEGELRQSHEKFSLIFEKAAFGAALARYPSGVFVDVNEAFLSMFGYERQQVIGRTTLEIGINPDAEGRAHLMRQLGESGSARDLEIALQTRAGETRIFLTNITLIELNGETHLLTTVQDITDRKTGEEALRRQAEALRAADQMKDEFLATLSHEMRTPLTSIIGWSQILLEAGVDERELQSGLEAIRFNARAQAQLIDDVLDVSRITLGKMRLERKAVDLADVVERAVGTVRPAAEAKQIAVDVKLDRSLGLQPVDPDRIQQVVWNLVANSIKFSDSGTVVHVELRGDANAILIEVTDQGRGIPRQFLPHVFERFRQGDSSSTRSNPGLGIGLALAKELVELHGGRIEVSSEEGKGSRFTVRLMRQESAASPATTADVGRSASALGGLKVLYVDDREDARVLISTMLRLDGAEVVLAASADEALALLSSDKPDVVVTDLAMPDHDGYELLNSIRGNPRWNGLPVIALSAQGHLDDEVRAASAGFDAFLRKPIESPQLTGALERVTRKRSRV